MRFEFLRFHRHFKLKIFRNPPVVVEKDAANPSATDHLLQSQVHLHHRLHRVPGEGPTAEAAVAVPWAEENLPPHPPQGKT